MCDTNISNITNNNNYIWHIVSTYLKKKKRNKNKWDYQSKIFECGGLVKQHFHTNFRYFENWESQVIKTFLLALEAKHHS